MLALHGFCVSNYHNKCKMALLEKGVHFTDVYERPSQDASLLGMSPMGKVPFLRTDEGDISESQVILEYLEEKYPQVPLLPSDPFAAAKVRELCNLLDMHLELNARRLYAQAFFGRPISDEIKVSTKKELDKAIAAFSRLAQFAPFIAGKTFTLADCAAAAHLPLISMATKAIYGQDLLAHLPIKAYIGQLRERESMQKIEADRKAEQARAAAKP
jgi:glutathione S-transferase